MCDVDGPIVFESDQNWYHTQEFSKPQGGSETGVSETN